MGNTGRNRLTKVRHYVTNLGCVVAAEKTLNQQTACIDEDVVLSHPRPLLEVAFDQTQTLERRASCWEWKRKAEGSTGDSNG